MSSLENQEVAYNKPLYKFAHMYQIFDPKSIRVFNCHVHRLTGILITVFVECFIFFGMLGLVMKMEDNIDNIDLVILLFLFMFNFSSLLKLCVFIKEAKTIWTLLDVTRIQFFKSHHCRKHFNKLKKRKDELIQLTNYTFGLSILTYIVWIVYPICANSFMETSENVNQRYLNVLNLRYPVSIYTYNKYFYIWYAVEVVAAGYFCFSTIIDTFLVSLCYILITQYEVLAQSFGNIRFPDGLQNRKSIFKRFKS